MSEQQETRERLTGIRRLSARNLARSHAEIPGVHIVEECDLTGVDLRRLVGVVLAAMGRVARDHPRFNAHFDGEELTMFERCDVAVAVDTERGLLVPAVRDCGAKSVDEIVAEVAELAGRARGGGLSADEMRGSTVTFTSPGRRGGVLATPMINPPQTAIVGIYRAVERAVVRDGEIAVRSIANLTVTFDHRVVDGASAGDYTVALAAGIERIGREEAPA